MPTVCLLSYFAGADHHFYEWRLAVWRRLCMAARRSSFNLKSRWPTKIKKSLAAMELPGLAIQQHGEDGRDYLVRFSTPNPTSEGIRKEYPSSLEKSFAGNPASIQRLEMVGQGRRGFANAALEAMYFAILLDYRVHFRALRTALMIAALMAAVLGSAMYVMGFLGMDMVYRVIGALALTLLISWKLKLNYALGAIVGFCTTS